MNKLVGTSQAIRDELGDKRNQIRQPLYSSIDLEAGDDLFATKKFFTQSVSDNLSQTNLQQQSQLDAETSFLIQGMRLECEYASLDGATSLLLPLIMNYSSLQFNIVEKQYLQVPFYYLSGRLTFRQPSDLDVLVYSHLGATMGQAMLVDAAGALAIGPVQAFTVTWQTYQPACAADLAILEAGISEDEVMRVYMMLLGVRRRPLQ